jgi:protein associated with RNAse G/E
MEIGDRVLVRAYKSDGTSCRWWHATVEAVEPDRIVSISSVGHRVEGTRGVWVSQHAIRVFYWLDRWYSLLEVYAPDGTLEEIFVNISSPVEIEGSQMKFTDYELDVSRKLPHEAVMVDEEEFQEAASEYGYSEEFWLACHQVAREAIDVANSWEAKGMPATEA